jgi:hypothetical protein
LRKQQQQYTTIAEISTQARRINHGGKLHQEILVGRAVGICHFIQCLGPKDTPFTTTTTTTTTTTIH